MVGVSIIPLYVFAVTMLGNSYDAFEGGRLKFLLEPVIFIFIVVQAFAGVRYLYLGARGELGSRRIGHRATLETSNTYRNLKE